MSAVTLLFVALALLGGLAAVTLNNILHAVFCLGISLAGVAGLFFVLGSPFVGTMQVLIYIGGITIAMVFAVMLSYSIGSGGRREGLGRRLVGVICAGTFFVALASAITQADFGSTTGWEGEDAGVAGIGEALLTHYNLVFETLSVVLLVAIMGAITIANREPDPEPDAGEGEAKE